MHDILRLAGREARLLSEQSSLFGGGVVCTAHMAKGLESDQVIVPDVSAKNHRTIMD